MFSMEECKGVKVKGMTWVCIDGIFGWIDEERSGVQNGDKYNFNYDNFLVSLSPLLISETG